MNASNDWYENDVRKHQLCVTKLLLSVAIELQHRALEHDASKLIDPERSGYQEVTPQLQGVPFGTPEYKALIEQMRPAVDHHKAVNRHHPEFFAAGVSGMTLVDLVEMVMDWMAAAERNGGDLLNNLDFLCEKYAISPDLRAILTNTVEQLHSIHGQPHG